MLDFSITVSRERLRPHFGDGFTGAPLGASQFSQRTTDQNRGVKRDEPQTAQPKDVDRALDI